MNALYGLQKRIVGAGLLTATQYSRAESGTFACFYVSSSATAMSFSQIFVLFTVSQPLSRKCKIILIPSTHHSMWIEMEEIALTVVAMMGILLKRPTVTIIGQKSNLTLLSPINVTNTDLSRSRPSHRFFLG